MTKNTQKIIGLVVVLVLVGGGAWFAFKKFKQPIKYKQYASHEFRGNFVSAKDKTMVLDGFFDIVDHPELAQPNKTSKVNISWDQDTEFIKQEFTVPAGTKEYYLRDIPQTYSQVNLATFLDDINKNAYAIEVKANENIYGENSFTADQIIYERTIIGK